MNSKVRKLLILNGSIVFIVLFMWGLIYMVDTYGIEIVNRIAVTLGLFTIYLLITSQIIKGDQK